MDDLEDDAVLLLSFDGDICVLDEIRGLLLKGKLVAIVLLIFVRIEVAVDRILQPVLGEFVNGLFVAGVKDVSDDEINLGLGVKSLLDFFGDDAGLNDNFVLLEELGMEEGMGVSAKGDCPGVAVP